MTTTERRQIPPPSHFSASPKNRSSSAHGENFWPDICSGRSSRHVIFFFLFRRDVPTTSLHLQPTFCPPPKKEHHILLSGAISHPLVRLLPPTQLFSILPFPPTKNALGSSLPRVGLRTCTVTWLARRCSR